MLNHFLNVYINYIPFLEETIYVTFYFIHCGSVYVGVSVTVRQLIEIKYVSKSDNSLKVVCKGSQTMLFNSTSCLIEVMFATIIHG